MCGEFLNAEAQHLAAYLGVDLWSLGAKPADNLQLACRDACAVLQLPSYGAGLSRFRLDEALLQVAARAGAEIVRGQPVTRVEWTGTGVIARASSRAFHATYAALATGKHDLRGLARNRASTVSFKMHLEATTEVAEILRGRVRLIVFPGGYLGACLVEDGIVSLCWMFQQDTLRETGAEWGAQAKYLSQQSKFIGEIVGAARPLWKRPLAVAGIPYGFLRSDVISHALYPLGDQLAVIPSFTGAGISIALYSGISAAQAILRSRPADEYQSQIVSALKPQLISAGAANFLMTNPATQRAGVAVHRLFPSVIPGLARFIAKATRLRKSTPADLDGKTAAT